jgi:hypothetical protein
MKGILVTCMLSLITPILFSQPNKELINSYFLKNRLYPLSFVDFFINSNIDENIKSIKVNQNDSIYYELIFTKNRLSDIISDNTDISIKYRFGVISKIKYSKQDSIFNKTKFVKLFPFTLVFNNGLKYSSLSGFSGIKKYRSLTGFQTFSKTKIKYKKGRVHKTIQYDWHTSAQKCYFWGYSNYQYINDTTVIAEIFDNNDSLATKKTYIFDNNGNILKESSLIKKKATGWGIGVTYYAYDGNKTETKRFDYVFDDRNNWIERIEYVNDIIHNKTTREIVYEK